MHILNLFRRKKAAKKRRKKRMRTARQKPRPVVTPIHQPPERAEKNLELAGDLILKQRIEEDGVIKEIYAQPVRLETPNMVTVGGKLDTILEKLDKKPDREWFEHDYTQTLKDVLKLAQTPDVRFEEKQAQGDRSRYVMRMEQEAQQKLQQVATIVTPALILRTLQEGELPVGELAKRIEISRMSVWKHLKRLEEGGKVQFKKRGNFKFVSLCRPDT